MEGDGKIRAKTTTNSPKKHLYERAGGKEKEVEGNKTRSFMLTAATRDAVRARLKECAEAVPVVRASVNHLVRTCKLRVGVCAGRLCATQSLTIRAGIVFGPPEFCSGQSFSILPGSGFEPDRGWWVNFLLARFEFSFTVRRSGI
jgi:hypothetical protein